MWIYSAGYILEMGRKPALSHQVIFCKKNKKKSADAKSP